MFNDETTEVQIQDFATSVINSLRTDLRVWKFVTFEVKEFQRNFNKVIDTRVKRIQKYVQGNSIVVYQNLSKICWFYSLLI